MDEGIAFHVCGACFPRLIELRIIFFIHKPGKLCGYFSDQCLDYVEVIVAYTLLIALQSVKSDAVTSSICPNAVT
ncbi:hypothetical protein O997_06515 [Anaplasma phagocytophilum str. MRK]|nr:hypothetical protein O997_06515 [Anaplasma phagocytophilum str. MRK]